MPQPKLTLSVVGIDGKSTGKSFSFECDPVDETKAVYRLRISGSYGEHQICLTVGDAIILSNAFDDAISAKLVE